jgi:tetratricopeptide (TPR) repeat protein
LTGLPEPRRRARALLAGALLTIAALAIFGQAGAHDFVNFDDPEYVYDNQMVRGGLSWEGLAWAFTHAHANNWHPLTWLSHMLDCELFGLDAGAHHLVSVALHAANAWLLCWALALLTQRFWPSVLVALLFAVHPLRVESVAWVAERKDVLSGLFFVLTLLAYRRYSGRPSAGRYALVAGALALGLLAKPMLVTVPFVLLLLDFWPLRRIGAAADIARLALEKLPLVALAGASSVVTVAVQSASGAVQSTAALSITERLAHAPVAWLSYLAKACWPSGLAVFYPHPALAGANPPLLAALGALALLAALTLLAVAAARRCGAWMVGWSWFLGMLVPVIGIVQVGDQSWADRYAYLPVIGLQIAAVFGLHTALPARLHRPAAIAGALACVAYGAAAWHQVGYWRNSVTLCERALAVTEDNYLAHVNLGIELRRRGELGAARAHYREAMRIRPGNVLATSELGSVLAELGELKEAQRLLEQAVAAAPGYGHAHTALGIAYGMDDQLERARACFDRALELDPNDTHALVGIGTILFQQNRVDEAAQRFAAALAIDPGHLRAGLNLAELHASRGEWDAAIRRLETVLRFHPGDPTAHRRLEQVRRRRG